MKRFVVLASLVFVGGTAAWSQTALPAPSGTNPDPANFTGRVTGYTTADIRHNRYSFAPGARTNWHTHERGQTIIVEEGRARTQRDGMPVEEYRAQEVFYTAPGVRHWHGATPDAPMRQVSVSFGVTNWMERVTEAQYAGGAAQIAAQPAGGGTPFKLGTFARGNGRPFVGIVLKESSVIEFPAATDMKDLIARYDQLRPQILEAIRTGKQVDVKTLKILPPIIYPTTMMNVAVNYREHDVEMARIRQGSPGQTAPTAGGALPNTTSAPGIWERKPDDPRWNPFMFLKAPSAIVAEGENVVLPPGRDRIEWECELGVVIGRQASRVPIERAMDYVFGYTLENDISDRGGRGDTRYGSDWLVTKNHDTFAPMGPFITPKEFVKDVHNLQITFSLNGEVLQQGSTNQMIHNVPEQMHYATNLLTLRPGDVIATGTIPGSGSARTPPVLLKQGDRMVCTYEGVGTLTNPVVRHQ